MRELAEVLAGLVEAVERGRVQRVREEAEAGDAEGAEGVVAVEVEVCLRREALGFFVDTGADLSFFFCYPQAEEVDVSACTRTRFELSLT